MPEFVIEREMPGAGSMPAADLRAAACTSNEVLASLVPRVQWQHSYVTGDKIYCVYIAEDEEAVREHARLSGQPCDVVNQVSLVIDPTFGGR